MHPFYPDMVRGISLGTVVAENAVAHRTNVFEQLVRCAELTAFVGRSLLMTNHDPRMMRQELERVREWAIEQLSEGTERPWSWYQYRKLREAVESVLAGMDVAQPMEDEQKASPDRGDSLRLVGAVDLQPH